MGWIAKQDQLLDQVNADASADQTAVPQPQRPLSFTRPELRYIWQEGDSILAVALKHGADPEEILDLNLVEEHELRPGDELKIPQKHVIKRTRTIRYEALDSPVVMHVNKPEGIQQYSFGNIKDPADVPGKGHFPLGTNITIHGIAHVPVGEDEFLAYYMDSTAFGNLKQTGRPAWNFGYAWSELTEGTYHEPEPTILEEPDIPEITIFDEIVEPEPEPVVEAPKDDVVQPINPDYQAEKYLYETDITLHELRGNHKPIFRHRLDPVWIIGTFTHDGQEYYQPGKVWGETIQSGLLWPIPMDAVLPEDELFDFSQGRRQLTRQEVWWEFVVKRYTMLMANKNKKD